MSPLPPTLSPLLTAAVRHLLTALAGFLLARGLIHPDSENALIQTASGLALGAIGFGWSMARAGRLGQQARTLTEALDRLLWACTPTDPGTVTQTSDNQGGPVVTTVTTPLAPPPPAPSDWPAPSAPAAAPAAPLPPGGWPLPPT